jgi:hypothetical protein
MRTRNLAVLALVLIPRMSLAADPAVAAKAVAPFLDDRTIAVAHVNLTGIDVDAAVERFAKVAGVDAQLLADPRRAAHEGLAAIRKAGANDFYVVVSLADLPDAGPFVLVPRAGANDEELKRYLVSLGHGAVAPVGGMMFCGSKSSLDRLRTLKPAARPDLEAAFGAVGGSAVQVAFVPGDDHRKVVAEMMPTLPKEVGGGPGTILTKGARWAAVGVGTNPTLAVKVIVQSDDAAAATALAQAVGHGLDTVGQDQAARRMFPKLAEMVAAVRPKVADARLTIVIDDSAPGVAAALATAVGLARSNASRTVSMNNLKQLALGFHVYADDNKGTLPPAAIVSKDGKPLLSWRVAILPYISQDALHKQFKLDEPWDSEHNKKLIEKMPTMYRSPTQKIGDGKTTYLAPTGMADKAHIGVLGVQFKDITDGTSNTIMLVEANDDAAVVWTKPDDLAVDVKDPLKGLIGHYEQGFIASFGDGSVRFIRRTIKPFNLIGAFTRDGGELADFTDF